VTDLRTICEKLVGNALNSDDSATAILVMFKHPAGRLRPPTRSGGRGRARKEKAAAGGNRNKPTMPPVAEVDEEEEEEDCPTLPPVAEKELHNEASSSERRPLLYINNDIMEEC
jgi:hypothetical protein